MSKGVKRVLGVVAAVIVPAIAPAVAGFIGVSGTIGTALVGAGLGAATVPLGVSSRPIENLLGVNNTATAELVL